MQMPYDKPENVKTTAGRIILSGIPVVFILGGITHFLYDWTGGSAVAGLFAPVNESPWEHLKMAFWANLFWWMIGYIRLKKGGKLSAAGWFSSCAASLYIAPLFIVSFYYTYTGALGFSSMILDVLSLLLGLGVSRYAAAHIFKYGKPAKACLALSAAAISLLAAVFIVFTFYPPRLPMFLDRNTGLYGI